MVNKLVDIKRREKKSKPQFIWGRKKGNHKFERALPLLLIGFLLILILNMTYVGFRGKQIAREIVELSKLGFITLEEGAFSAQHADFETAMNIFQESKQVFVDLKDKTR